MKYVVRVKSDTDLNSFYSKLDEIPNTYTHVHVLGIDADEYTVRKVVGYLENRGFKVTWKETRTDAGIVRDLLNG